MGISSTQKIHCKLYVTFVDFPPPQLAVLLCTALDFRYNRVSGRSVDCFRACSSRKAPYIAANRKIHYRQAMTARLDNQDATFIPFDINVPSTKDIVHIKQTRLIADFHEKVLSLVDVIPNQVRNLVELTSESGFLRLSASE